MPAKIDSLVVDSTEKTLNDSTISDVKEILVARGSEPGWYAEFYPDSANFQFDHGEVRFSLKENFKSLFEDRSVHLVIPNSESNTGKSFGKIDITTSFSPCKEEASGEIRDRKITIHFNGREYFGCAYEEVR